MQVIRSPKEMTAWSVQAKKDRLTLGFVPTMGFLHQGHESLMRSLRPDVDRLIVSIYVNPLQFGEDADLASYPRDPQGDELICEAAGVDILFMPAALYPDGFCSSVTVHGLADRLCGAHRPGHFDGVCTVVARLFGLTRCDVAVFGEKDYQQLAVIRQMVRDLALPVSIRSASLVRDTKGLALSSRNVRLGERDGQRALSLFAALSWVRSAVESGESSVAVLLKGALDRLDVDRLDYLEIVDGDTLKPVREVSGECRVLVAAFYGVTRLIDNVPLGRER